MSVAGVLRATPLHLFKDELPVPVFLELFVDLIVGSIPTYGKVYFL